MARTSQLTGAVPGRTEASTPLNGGFVVRPVAPSAAGARDLIAAHLALMSSQTPAESVHAIDLTQLEAADVRFFGLYSGDQLIGIGAYKLLSRDQAELKSMHVARAARGAGGGRALVSGLINAARDDGMSRLFLETGTGEEFVPARKLYAAAGFVECAPFGDYRPDPLSIFMTRLL